MKVYGKCIPFGMNLGGTAGIITLVPLLGQEFVCFKGR
jgi:hypothetical protein